MLARRFSEEFQGSPLVPSLGDEALQHLAFVIDSPPEVVPLAVDPDEHLVEVPLPIARFPPWIRRFRISAAKIGPDRCHQKRTVSWQISMPRSCSRSSTFRSDGGKRMYIITARRMISGLVLMCRNGLRLVMDRGCRPAVVSSSEVLLTVPLSRSGMSATVSFSLRTSWMARWKKVPIHELRRRSAPVKQRPDPRGNGADRSGGRVVSPRSTWNSRPSRTPGLRHEDLWQRQVERADQGHAAISDKKKWQSSSGEEDQEDDENR